MIDGQGSRVQGVEDSRVKERKNFSKKMGIDFIKPFHAAEQHSKVQNNDSAEYPARGCDFPKRLHFVSSAGESANSGPSERLHFLWFVSLCK